MVRTSSIQLLLSAAFLLGIGCSGGGGVAGSDESGLSDTAAELPGTDISQDIPGFDTIDIVGPDLPGDDATGQDQSGPGETATGDPGSEDQGAATVCPGDPGCSCTDNEDCYSGICTETMDGWVCSSACQSEESCPPGWKCLVVGSSGSDVLYGCVDPFAHLCQPCQSDADCVPAVAGPGKYLCIEHGPEGSFCGVECGDLQSCPSGFTCVDVMVGRGFVKQCSPEGNTDCPCTQKYSDQGNLTDCHVQNEIGLCWGERTCDTECNAETPKAEECNGKDDDCDGLTDEDVTLASCPLENAYGTCNGKALCVGGQIVCQGTYAAPETCNGLDDDCDGDTDELFPDADKDGVADCVDPDMDGDGIENLEDNCPEDFNPDQANCDTDKDGDACDADDDDDGTLDVADNCRCEVNPGQGNVDGDSFGDACDCDIDGDEVANGAPPLCPPAVPEDNCPTVANPDQGDMDLDGLGDACDEDRDGDGYLNIVDNCPDLPNDQADNDLDGVGDDCDPDDDNDGVDDGVDNCPLTSNPDQSDIDDDGLGDLCDPDMDDDGVVNEGDNCPGTPNPEQTDENANGIGDDCEGDWDGDGLSNEDDNCPWVPNVDQEDMDQDDEGDACDCDIDADGIFNDNPGCDTPAPADNCPMTVNPDQENLDGDPLGDHCDPDRDGDLDPNESDCEPDDPAIFHGQQEACDGIDNNCNAQTDEADATGCSIFYFDGDLDGYGIDDNQCLCAAEDFYTAAQKNDCADDDPAVNPGAVEDCNGLDDDCNGAVDEEDATGCTVYFKDNDTDGFGLSDDSRCLCTAEPPYVTTQGGDCNDFNDTTYPGATESCNFKDDDCDDLTDEEDALGCTDFFLDQDGDTFGVTADSKCLCAASDQHTALGGGDCDDGNGAINPGAAEICNGLDDDCDGGTDEVADLGTTTCGLGECEHTVDNCMGGSPQNCDAMEGSTVETCNAKDDDCDGDTDEGTTDCIIYYFDNDGDGFGLLSDSICDCGETGKYSATESGDCNDSNNNIYPGADEACNSKDDDCDGDTDEVADLGTTTCGLGECEHTVDNCLGGSPQNCDAMEGSTVETCNGKDDDCNGETDEVADLGTTTCGLGECAHTVDNCAGGSPQNCDDMEGSVAETCNGKDDDCDGNTDEEAVDCTVYYKDADNDGFGLSSDSQCLCSPSDPWDATDDNDCDDSNSNIFPGASESCNNKDDDCDGGTDEVADLGTTTCGVGECHHTVDNCINGAEQNCGPFDGATAETCNSKDDDCDGATDEKADLGETTCGMGECVHTVDNCGGGVPQVCDEFQGATAEICDGKDNNCNGTTDEGLSAPLCPVQIGVCAGSVKACGGAFGWLDCSTVNYQANSPNYQTTESICDGLDNDCDGPTDEGLGAPLCPMQSGVCSGSHKICGGASGWLNCTSSTYIAHSQHYQTTETSCDGLDNDCDGPVDEGLGTTTCGVGECYHTVNNCENGQTQNCLPMEGASTENCDNKDNDCDGQTDENTTGDCTTWYLDSDNDLYGLISSPKCMCNPSDPWDTTNKTDCYDSNALAKPGQTSYYPTHRGDGSYDYNCDSVSEKYGPWLVVAGECAVFGDLCSGGTGYDGSIPACGALGTWRTGCYYSTAGWPWEWGCKWNTSESRRMKCR